MKDNWLPLPRYTLRKHLVLYLLNKLKPTVQSCFELGYGSGDLMISLAEKGFNVSGYDFSPEAFRIAAKRIRKRSLATRQRITLMTGNKTMLSSCDAAIALEVFEHVKDDLDLMRQLHQIIKPGGYLIFSVPAHHSKWGENDIWAGHYRRYERPELIQKLKSASFTPCAVWSYGYPLICLLDLMIHRNRKNDIQVLEGVSKEQLTQNSGISREKNLINLMASWPVWVWPFFYIQRLFLNQDLSSAYLVMAQKPVT